MNTSFCALLLIVPAMAQQPSSTATVTQLPFSSISPSDSDTLRFGAELPKFEVNDISGRTWRSEDLRGKFTVIYLWNTFEARAIDAHPSARPSVSGFPDLPEVQRFHDKVKTEKDIQVLTFCRDYDYTHASEYMKAAGYTFPVIADWVLTNRLFPASQSRYLLVNPEGRLSFPLRGWSFGRLLFEVERAAARK